MCVGWRGRRAGGTHPLCASLPADVLHSLVGFFVSTLVLVVWILVFQLSWRSWGIAGEALLVVPYNDPSAW
jgi:hypothetical protein